ncbi:short-chain dehydrogenase/reductase family 42E member 1 [Ananas comosus]|uniref:Short-chain dehydrogenase/reductase family 42E member 1 n=1 Tax=Ananas comosus TaxID=4615 RepID=A0A199UET4_ANACO|nr:short-chain dehydrogenase/reductase family 42E member 1 [Ananas comosus]OAY63244.1 Short-chain dehydrogenase/reductase family 42E member 1 [Ananas comosus]
MHLSASEGIDGNRFVVTGGLGFVGSALCLELARRGAAEVRSLDLRTSSPWSRDLHSAGVRCIQGDVRRKKDVERALRGADCVFHLASYGMSGKEMLQAGRVDGINISGTCNILDVCHELGVKRLVYVSTCNVVFGGKEIVNGNESLQYFPIDDHVDPYGRSKSVAEQLVLKSNGRPSKDKSGTRLYTCAIRPAGIYGPGEERHLPRILSLAKMGLLFFKVGGTSIKTDWVYVENLVLALILASMGLLDDIPGRAQPVAAGQPYFICDGSPVNTFDFIVCPLLQSLDYNMPKITLKVEHALLVSRVCWIMYTLLYPWLNRRWLPQPLLLPAEVYKVGVTHYFSILKAREELGYMPMVSPREGMAATISYWQERKRKELDGPTIYVWLFVIVGMSILFCAGFLPPVEPVRWAHNLSLFFLRSMLAIRLVFIVAVMLHVAEAFYAWSLARRIDPENSKGWFWQTLALGFFSLRYLLKRARS